LLSQLVRRSLPEAIFVELVLHGGSEVVVDQTAEVLLQQTRHRERTHDGTRALPFLCT